MDRFNLFGIPKNLLKNLYFEKTGPFSAESFTGKISIPLWIIIMSKLEIFQN